MVRLGDAMHAATWCSGCTIRYGATAAVPITAAVWATTRWCCMWQVRRHAHRRATTRSSSTRPHVGSELALPIRPHSPTHTHTHTHTAPRPPRAPRHPRARRRHARRRLRNRCPNAHRQEMRTKRQSAYPLQLSRSRVPQRTVVHDGSMPRQGCSAATTLGERLHIPTLAQHGNAHGATTMLARSPQRALSITNHVLRWVSSGAR